MAFDLIKPEEWGPTKHGWELILNTAVPFDAISPAVIDVEDDEHGGFVGIGLCLLPGTAVYFTELNSFVRHVLTIMPLVAHNGKSDFHKLRKWGINVKASQLVFDTMLASYVMDSTKESHGLKHLAKTELGIEYPAYKELTGTGRTKTTLDKLPVNVVAAYNGMDVLSTFKLWKLYEQTFTAKQREYFQQIEMLVNHLLLDMESKGVMVNVPYLNMLDRRFTLMGDKYMRRLVRFCGDGFNPNSPKQVKERLFERIGCTEASTGKRVLEGLADIPAVQILSSYREVTKLRGTYTKPLSELGAADEANRIHCTFNQVSMNAQGDMKGIRTGRLSCSEPNLQNQPTRSDLGDMIRSVFVAKPGHIFIDADYSQIEWRIAASFSGDQKMQQALLDGKDIYQTIADATGVGRTTAKTAALAMNYGAGGYKLAQILKVTDKQGFDFVDKYKQAFPEFFQWKARIELKDYVETLFGRRIRPGTAHLNVPYLVQGSAGDIIKQAMIECAARNYPPILQIHDELIFEEKDAAHSPIYADNILIIMEGVAQLAVPLKVEIGMGRTWREAKK